MVDGREINVIGNNFVDFRTYMEESEPELYKQFDEEKVDVRERVHLPTLLSVIERVRADGVDFNQALERQHGPVDSQAHFGGRYSGRGELPVRPVLWHRRCGRYRPSWATAACAPWASFCKTRSAWACRAWSAACSERMAIQDLEQGAPAGSDQHPARFGQRSRNSSVPRSFRSSWTSPTRWPN